MKKFITVQNFGIPAFAAVIFLCACVLSTAPRASAEPIVGEESLSLPSSSAQKREADDAMSLFKAGDYAGSLRLWREAERKNPDMSPAQVIMAQLFLQRQMVDKAKKALEEAMVDAPNDPEPYVLSANLAMTERNTSQAESMLKKAAELMPAFKKSGKRAAALQSQIDFGLASVAELRGDWAGAQKIYEGFQQRDPKNTAVLQRIAFCLFQQKNIDGALEKLRESIADQSGAVAPEALLSQFYQRVNDVENAKKWMDEAVKKSPKSLETRLAAGYFAMGQEDFDNVRKHAIAAALIDSNNFDAKMLRGLAAVCQKDFVAAELFFDSAYKQKPTDFVAGNNLALSLIEQGEEAKNKKALEIAEANAKKFPKMASALSTYGWVLYKLGRLPEAEKVLRSAGEVAPMSVDTSYYIARVLVDENRKEEAKKFLESGLNQKGISMFREEAKQLLEELKQ